MFKNLSIRAILTSALALFLFLFAASGYMAYRLLDNNRQSINTMYDRSVLRARSANALAFDLMRGRLAMLSALASLRENDLAASDAAAKRTDEYVTISEAQLARLLASPETSVEGKPLYDAVLVAYKNYMDQGYRPMLDSLRSANFSGANTTYQKQVTPLGTAFTTAIANYTNFANSSGDELRQATDEEIQTAVVGVSISVAFVAAILIGLFVLFTRRVFTPLRQAVALFDKIAAGDLSQRVQQDGTNEIGMMYAAVDRMQQGLIRTVSAVRSGVNEINVGAGEIAAGNTDLSSRTEQQAASLEETAASMEQLASSVKLNADSSRQASTLAADASQAAAHGGEAVGQVVGTMRAISKSSSRIAEIVGVIDGIAFQTNILALNAAVEAARAGEQGKGFAVVASEVRSLAQRSSQAAREIKGLIDESVNTVRAGSLQAEQAGDTMQNVVASFQRVADIVSEISAASAEQSTGINQVNQAVAQMDAVTQQNAALVEEAAAAAASLEVQARQLRASVAVFQLDSDAGGPVNVRRGADVHDSDAPRLLSAY